ncbi:MAG: DUF4416 family protein [Thermodesulfobacteriota bacterium]
MSLLLEPRPVKLLMSLIYGHGAHLDECRKSLSEGLGKIDYTSRDILFDYTKYYEEEMGTGLRRVIITFRDLIKREEIAEVKIFTNRLEKVFSYQNKRTINIDPGYIAQEHLVLTTGKGYAHRPYLGKGVYADLTLIYTKDEFRTLEWTYPDYGSAEMRELFMKLRNEYMSQLREVSKQ